MYNIPSVYSLIEEQPSKTNLKKLFNQSTHSYIEASWTSDVENKPSLKYVNPNSLKVGKNHPVWSSVRYNTMDNKKTQLKCKLLTGTYILQGNRAAFNQHEVNPICKLCSMAPETRQHFLSECSAFVIERQEFQEKIKSNPVFDRKSEWLFKKPNKYDRARVRFIRIIELGRRTV